MKRAVAPSSTSRPVGHMADYAFEHAAVWMAAADADLNLVAANAAWRRGFGAEDAVGRPLSDFLSTEALASLQDDAPEIAPVIEVREACLEVRLQRAAEFVIASLTDVTSRTVLDRARDAAQSARAFLLGAAGVTGVHYDPDTDLHSLTDSFDHLGRPGVSFTTAELLASAHPEDHAKCNEALSRVVAGAASEETEVRTRMADGSWGRLKLLMRPGPQKPSGRFEAFVLSQDVTALAEARDEARAKARQLGLALHAANAAVFEIDFPGRKVDYSSGFERLAGRGLTFEDVLAGKPVFDSPDLAAFESMKGKRRAILDMRVRRETSERWVRLFSDVVRGTDGSPIHAVGLMIDIDDAKRQELNLQAAQEAAEAATEAKSRFLASMSHEIRTPMNGVVGVLHLLKEESISAAGRGLLDEALACAGMLSQLINDVLDFSKIEAGKLEISPQPSSTRAALDGVIALLRPQADAKAVALRAHMELDLDWVVADPVRLRQCLFNLVGNAVKFTDAGEVAVSMRRAGPSRLRVEVADTGKGVPPAARNRLFQRFEQLGAAAGGTGLGLAITRNLAELMGGEVGFRPAEPHGSVFWFEIEAPPAAAPAAQRDLAAEGSLDGLRVLLVDDNRTNRIIGAKVLEALGARPTLAEGGLEAVEAVQRERFDLVLMDINMPGIDGVEAARRIRMLPNGDGALPVLALTANVMAHQRESYLAAGMDGVVGKPFAPAELLQEIARVIQPRTRRLNKAS